MRTPTFSIVIRTLDERPALARLLASIERQTLRAEAELIVVDNASTDGTAELAASAGARLVTIAREAFTYPRSMNLGCAAARGRLIVLTVGHAALRRDDWLARAARHFDDARVAGAYGPCIPPTSAPLAERLVLGGSAAIDALWGVTPIRQVRMGVLGATGCVVRADLWRAHPFDEAYGLGGEDGAWARWALAQGFGILRDPALAVEHSHRLSLVRLVRQIAYWNRLRHPSTFSREALRFRVQ